VIPNWNGARYLRACLDSLRAQTHQPLEILVVDGASMDDSRALVASEYPEVRLVALHENRGFAGNVNAGIRAARGEIVALLNNDAEADPAWLAELMSGFDDPLVGSCASKILLSGTPVAINTAGDAYGRDGLPRQRGARTPDLGQYDRREDVFGACGGAAAYRRRMLEDVGLFDERLFFQCEDVDLAFRAQLAGYRCRYVPTARVYHRLGGTGGGPLSSYYVGRNNLWVLLKDAPAGMLLRHWPRMMAAQAWLTLRWLWHAREPAARAGLRGQARALLDLPEILRARRGVQRRRRVGDRYLESILA
jgi:GT2 family glycosyltransferase